MDFWGPGSGVSSGAQILFFAGGSRSCVGTSQRINYFLPSGKAGGK